MNISLQIILNPPTHDISNRPNTEAARSRPGDIISVYLTENTGPMNTPGLAFVHITGAPNVPLQRIINKVCGPAEILEDYSKIIRVLKWNKMVTANQYPPFIGVPTKAIGPNIDWAVHCLPVNLDITKALFTSIDSELIQVNGNYLIKGKVPTYTVSGQRWGVSRKHGWRIPPSKIPAAKRAELLANKEITITWAQAKPFIRKKLVSIRLNPTSDDETTNLVDGDLV